MKRPSPPKAARAPAFSKAIADSPPTIRSEPLPAQPEAVKRWSKILERIQAQANPQTYATWFATTKARRLEGSNGESLLVVRAPNRVARCWLASSDGRHIWEPVADGPVEFVSGDDP